MIYFPKSEPIPLCLPIEKEKANGNYKCGDVLIRLQADFYDKCYICESKGLTSINVEHFQSHQGNKDLKFDWYNLFYVCGHCNNIKLHLYDYILNCTDPNDLVDEWIRYEIRPSFPNEKVKLTVLRNDQRVRNTVELLEKVYNGHTMTKTLEAANIRQNLIEEIQDFYNSIEIYQTKNFADGDKEIFRRHIQSRLSADTPFTAFKKWIIRDNPVLQEDFGKLV